MALGGGGEAPIDYSTEEVKNTSSLKDAIEMALKNKTITQEEALGLEKKILDEKGNITKEARAEWRKLDYSMRIAFQEAIGAGKDGAIGNDTVTNLKKKAQAQSSTKDEVFTGNAQSLGIPSSLPNNGGTIITYDPDKLKRQTGTQPVGPPIRLTNYVPNGSIPAPNNQPPVSQESQSNKEDTFVNPDDLYKGLSGYMEFKDSKNEKFSINLNKPEIPPSIDPKRKQEALNLIELSKGIDGIDDGRISFTKDGRVILEVNTRGSDLYVESVSGRFLVSGQSEGKFFVENVSQDDLKKFIKNHDSENTKAILKELGVLGGELTFIGALSFLIRSGIGIVIPVAGSIALGIYRGVNLYNMYNLSTNTTVEIGEKLKSKPETLKQYLYLARVGYITGTSGDNYKTRDGTILSEGDLSVKFNELRSNPNTELRYQLLTKLDNRGYSPEYKKGGNYELDFVGLFDNSSIQFNGNIATIKTDEIKGKEFKADISGGKAFDMILNINEYLKTRNDINNSKSLPQNRDSSEVYGNDSNKISELQAKLTQLEKTLHI